MDQQKEFFDEPESTFFEKATPVSVVRMVWASIKDFFKEKPGIIILSALTLLLVWGYHGNLDLLRQCSQKKDGALQHADQLEIAPLVFCRDLPGHFADPLPDLHFRVKDSLDIGWLCIAHACTNRSVSPYLKIRF